MDEILLLLARKHAHSTPVQLTTSELGEMLKMSQQNASRRISVLEKAGFVRRSGEGLSLTDAGLVEVHSLYSDLREAFEKKPISISGTVISGLGEGKYYLSFPEYKSQILEKFGFIPYEGTLNVKLAQQSVAEKANFVRKTEPVAISGFKKEGRTFGDLFSYSCTVEGVKCALIIPARTHHPPDVIEIAAPYNLKKHLGKKDGDSVKIELG